MDSHNLKTASSYINNLLLARGLLRNGEPIEFVHPSKGEGGKEATMAQIINLVHDLILRRDRDQDHITNLAHSLQSVRAESAQHASNYSRLQSKHDDISRQLALVQSQERSARVSLRTSEAASRSLREEMLRLKTTVQQVRAACATDVRKRDTEIKRLKTHLVGQQRGDRRGLVGSSITITPGVTGTGASTGRDGNGLRGSVDVADPDYSLKQETTEFLTQLSQSLSDENDALIGLVRSTIAILKEVQGLPENLLRAVAHPNGDSTAQSTEHAPTDMTRTLPTSYEALAADMDTVVENLKNLLTNPNFVPIDEVEAREEEIVKLREGWEKMEHRWREVVMMMDGWRQRMLDGGDTVNLDELKMGLGLGGGFNGSLSHGQDDSDSRDMLEDVPEAEEAPSDAAYDDEDPVIEDDAPLPTPEEDVTENPTRDIFSLHLPPPQRHSPLKERSGNQQSPRRLSLAEAARLKSPAQQDENSEVDLVQPQPSFDLDNSSAKKTASAEPQRRIRKRRSSAEVHPEERSPKLTVAEKLAAAQAEAEVIADGLSSVPDSSKSARRKSSPRKTRMGGRPRRRKSTLSPEELEMLIAGGNGAQ